MPEIPEGYEVERAPSLDAMAMGGGGIPSGYDVESMPEPVGPPKSGIPSGYEAETPVPVDHPTEPVKPERPPNPNAEPSDEQIPGFLQTFTSATGRKAAEAAANLAAGTQILLPRGIGGKTLEEQRQAGEVAPQTDDYINKVLGQNITQGWTNPRWWVAQMGANLGGVAPGLGAAIGARAVRSE